MLTRARNLIVLRNTEDVSQPSISRASRPSSLKKLTNLVEFEWNFYFYFSLICHLGPPCVSVNSRESSRTKDSSEGEGEEDSKHADGDADCEITGRVD